MRRRTNKERMTIPEQLQKIKDEICSDYCRYSDTERVPSYLQDHFAKTRDEKCRKCPINDLRINF